MGLSLIIARGLTVGDLATPPRPDLEGFRDIVEPFFDAHCLDCHDDRRQRGELTLERIDADLLVSRRRDSRRIVAQCARELPQRLPPSNQRPRQADVRRSSFRNTEDATCAGS